MKTLIVYDSKTGCTEDCAKYISEKVKNSELFYIRSKNNVNLDEYDRIIIGSPIYVNNPSSRIKKFYSENLQILLTKDVKLFFSGATEKFDDMQELLFKAIGETLTNHASQIGYFGGELRYDRMNFLTKLFIKAIEKMKKDDVKPSIKFDCIDQFIEGVK